MAVSKYEVRINDRPDLLVSNLHQDFMKPLLYMNNYSREHTPGPMVFLTIKNVICIRHFSYEATLECFKRYTNFWSARRPAWCATLACSAQCVFTTNIESARSLTRIVCIAHNGICERPIANQQQSMSELAIIISKAFRWLHQVRVCVRAQLRPKYERENEQWTWKYNIWHSSGSSERVKIKRTEAFLIIHYSCVSQWTKIELDNFRNVTNINYDNDAIDRPVLSTLNST